MLIPRCEIVTPSRVALANAPLEYLCRRQLYSSPTDMKLIVLRAGFCEASFSRAKALAKASIIGVNIFRRRIYIIPRKISEDGGIYECPHRDTCRGTP